MSAPAVVRFFNIKSFTIGVTQYTGIMEVAVRDSMQRLRGSSDADQYDTFSQPISGDVEVTVTCQDVVQAQAMRVAAAGDLVFKGQTDTTGTTTSTGTVKNFKVFSRGTRDGHNALAGVTLTGYGLSPDGQTNPFTVTTP